MTWEPIVLVIDRASLEDWRTAQRLKSLRFDIRSRRLLRESLRRIERAQDDHERLRQSLFNERDTMHRALEYLVGILEPQNCRIGGVWTVPSGRGPKELEDKTK